MLPRLDGVVLGIAIVATSCAPGRADEAPATLSRSAAADVLNKGLEEARRTGDPEQQVQILRRAAEVVSTGRPENILAAAALRGPTGSPALEADKLAVGWREAVADAAEILKFEMLEESPLPDGFPKPPPVGEIMIQKYPVYRAAKADMNRGDNGAFMRLFGHIKSKGISMTTPVEMNYDQGDQERPRKVAMSFLYRNTGQGSLGGDDVKVQDVAESTAVTLGLRGYASEERVAEAKGHLEAWLASHAQEYRASGPIRTLIYNSPFIPEKQQFFEVQIPIEPADTSK